MHEPSSFHLGALWSGALGHVTALVHREQDRYRARGSLRQCIYYTTFATRVELKRSMLNIINAAVRKMNGARPAFSHGSLPVIKWTVCCYRETVCLPKANVSHPFLRTKIGCIKDSCAPQETVAHIS
jgi:hypothetical protein